MLIISGTIPQKDMPVIAGKVRREGDMLIADGQPFPSIQGTGAMISAALAATEYMGVEPPYIVVAGDIGKGDGTRLMYRYLNENMASLKPGFVALHYCQPFMNLLTQFTIAAEKMDKPPFLIADAGAMYAAKAAGKAGSFGLFTPDPSEIAFLADPNATHPAYIADHLFCCGVEGVPQLIESAYAQNSAAKVMVVKGSRDYIAKNGEVVATVEEPDVPVLETIGGTGDTITGLASAFIYAGVEPVEAGILAAKCNRMGGKMASPTPATKVSQIIDIFPAVFKQYLCEWSGICTTPVRKENK
ncbi:MAG: NAD(P)H-hydrate dehydratase [Dehalococcoidales bacterium]|nr:NAD(P)H-hydrate dehydratase [Dehalococcoidales bacterium]